MERGKVWMELTRKQKLVELQKILWAVFGTLVFSVESIVLSCLLVCITADL